MQMSPSKAMLLAMLLALINGPAIAGNGKVSGGGVARTIESKLDELAALPEQCLSAEEIETIRQIGDNTGCMALKGASSRHPADMEPRADEWAMRDDLMALAGSFGLRWTW